MGPTLTQAAGMLLVWFGGVLIIATTFPSNAIIAVQLGWFLLVVGYGLMPYDHRQPHRDESRKAGDSSTI